MRMSLYVTVLALTSTILSACGSSTGPSTSVSLTMTDFAFLPNTITVPAGQEITISVRNGGAVAHDLMIMNLGHEVASHGHVGEEERANAYWRQEPLESGATQVSRLTAPSAPGEYQILCGVAGHFEAGMVGKLLVVAAP